MANWNVHLDSGSVKVIYDAGYFVTKTEVIFYKKGQNGISPLNLPDSSFLHYVRKSRASNGNKNK